MSVEAKVAALISEFEIAINVGSRQGVQTDDVAVLLRTVEVTDPDTGTVIGTVTRPKLRLRVIEVQPDMAVAKSIEPASAIEHVTFAGGRSVARRTKGVTSDRMVADADLVYVGKGDAVIVEVKSFTADAVVSVDNAKEVSTAGSDAGQGSHA